MIIQIANTTNSIFKASSVALILFILCSKDNFSNAQIIPDASLPQATFVETQGNTDSISGGTRRGQNLFHSFYKFDLVNSKTAHFLNPIDLDNIFIRVTGSTASKIDGLIRSQGNANLYFLNPKGIIFDQNAQLNIGGSFLATTAKSIVFLDGSTFSAEISNENPPLLSINNPEEFIFNQSSGSITSQNQINLSVSPGLSVNNGQSITFIGNGINLNASHLSAPAGDIELISLSSGSFNSINRESTFANKNLLYQDINISNLSLVNVSSLSGGNINLVGNNISISEGSQLQSNSFSNQNDSGTISLSARNNIGIFGNISNTSPLDQRLAAQGIFVPQETAITTFTLGQGQGKGSNISIISNNLTIDNGAKVSAFVFGNGVGGDININVKDAVNISGQTILFGLVPIDGSPSELDIETRQVIAESSIVSLITSTTAGPGDAGNISIKANHLDLIDGGGINSATLNAGNGGSLQINLSGSLNIAGTNTSGNVPSLISTSTLGSGNSKTANISANRLILNDGGVIATTNVGSGISGDLTISANIIEINSFLNPSRVSQINSGSNGSGDAGQLKITSNSLALSDRGEISLSATSTGNAGDLELTSNIVTLDRSATIFADTLFSDGGSIDINSQLLLLKNNSSITTNALNQSDGGNIFIDSDLLVSSPVNSNSDISANSEFGSGGKINIIGSLFGFQVSSRISSEDTILAPNLVLSNDISAFSQFSPEIDSGSVSIEVTNPDPSQSLYSLPGNILRASKLIQTKCLQKKPNNFDGIGELYVVGRGGISISPDNIQTVRSVISGWIDNKYYSDLNISHHPSIYNPPLPANHGYTEAEGWQMTKEGKLLLLPKTNSHTGKSTSKNLVSNTQVHCKI